jgi:hypothetical protein
MPITKDGVEITSLESWERLAGPKSPNQWKDGRSAKEVARAWLESGGENLPEEVSAAFSGHKSFGPVLSWQAEPEKKLAFDNFPGEPPNIDLVVHAQDSQGPFLIAVEAKADEPFGQTVADTLAAAVERRLKNNRSNGVTRIEQLSAAILGPHQSGDPPLKGIRYQLLTAIGGLLCEAQRRDCDRAVMLVHEFVTDETDDDMHARNAMDLNIFIKRLTHGSLTAVQPGVIYGPFVVPGKPVLSAEIDLYLGKVSRNLREKS